MSTTHGANMRTFKTIYPFTVGLLIFFNACILSGADSRLDNFILAERLFADRGNDARGTDQAKQAVKLYERAAVLSDGIEADIIRIQQLKVLYFVMQRERDTVSRSDWADQIDAIVGSMLSKYEGLDHVFSKQSEFTSSFAISEEKITAMAETLKAKIDLQSLNKIASALYYWALSRRILARHIYPAYNTESYNAAMLIRKLDRGSIDNYGPFRLLADTYYYIYRSSDNRYGRNKSIEIDLKGHLETAYRDTRNSEFNTSRDLRVTTALASFLIHRDQSEPAETRFIKACEVLNPVLELKNLFVLNPQHYPENSFEYGSVYRLLEDLDNDDVDIDYVRSYKEGRVSKIKCEIRKK